MLSVSVHKDIGEYTEKVVGKLSARTLACTAGGLGAAAQHHQAAHHPVQPVHGAQRRSIGPQLLAQQGGHAAGLVRGQDACWLHADQDRFVLIQDLQILHLAFLLYFITGATLCKAHSL